MPYIRRMTQEVLETTMGLILLEVQSYRYVCVLSDSLSISREVVAVSTCIAVFAELRLSSYDMRELWAMKEQISWLALPRYDTVNQWIELTPCTGL